MVANFSHQTVLFDPKLSRPVVVIGVGMVGSMVTLALAKKGVSDITVIDDDCVASHNCPMSLYRPSDLGRRKVEALAEIIEGLTNTEIKVVPERYTGGKLPVATIVCSVDNMKDGRVPIWNYVKAHGIRHDLFIDTRTAAAYMEVFAISPRLEKEVTYYESFLHSDAESARQTCGQHGIIDVSLMVAGSVSATITRFWQTGQKKRYFRMKCDTPQEVL